MTVPVETSSHEGRLAVVTGAARGIGAALACGLARRGATVVAVDLRPSEETRRTIEETGGTCVSLVADVASEDGVRALRDEVHSVCGPCEILVNNAGIGVVAPFTQTDFALWRRVLQTNLDSQFLMAAAFAPDMVARGWGRIVNVASSSIRTTTPGMTAYMASKGGVLGLTSGLANDLAPHGVTVNAVSPAFTRTPLVDEAVTAGSFPPNIDVLAAEQQAIKRPATPDDLIGTVLFLTSEAAAFVTAQFLVADGGHTRHF